MKKSQPESKEKPIQENTERKVEINPPAAEYDRFHY